ncbi:hypothetical protein JMUB5056_0422 [Leptotrichia hongkongensis]|uniref:Uncharacterized protein n=1 Tax=Leptotrichia hongkongensis TaxID=554406 RepID=A0A510L4D3_9FUSO|nr:hypothetical protein JMUB5056_0422 [Leptotrichia hongkongensis]
MKKTKTDLQIKKIKLEKKFWQKGIFFLIKILIKK